MRHEPITITAPFDTQYPPVIVSQWWIVLLISGNVKYPTARDLFDPAWYPVTFQMMDFTELSEKKGSHCQLKSVLSHLIKFPFSMSIGIADYDPSEPCSVEELMSEADHWMYIQKKEKKQTGECPV